VRQQLGRELPLREVFAQPTLCDLALCVAQAPFAGQQALPIPRRGSQDAPLSFSQQRLWFLAQLDQRAQAAYHIPGAVMLHGTLDIPAVQAALAAIIERHEMLRMVIRDQDGEARWTTDGATADFVLARTDLGDLEEASRIPAAHRHFTEEAQAAFDLRKGPLIRARLLRLSDEAHVLMVTMHHLVSDGWSMNLLIQEFCALYAAHVSGQAPDLPPLSLQYADFSTWQRQALDGPRLAEQLAFWQTHLQDAPTLLDLPTDRPRPPVQRYEGEVLPIELDRGLSQAVHAFGRQHGTTPFMTLMAVWSLLLSKLSGQQDVVIGFPAANRPRQELEPLIGFFVNTLAVRIGLHGDPAGQDLLARVRAATLAAQSHQDVPFEQIVEAVRPVRSMAHTPVFQAMFTWNQSPEGAPVLPGLTLQALDADMPVAKFDLDLTLQEVDGRIVGSLTYASALFDRASMVRHVKLWRQLLASLLQTPELPVSQLRCMDQPTLQGILQDWSGAGAGAEPVPGRSVLALFEEQVKARPDAVAVVADGRQMSYAALGERAQALSSNLRAAGVQAHDHVAIALPRGIDLIVAILGTLMSGTAYVPLDATQPRERQRFVVRDSAPSALITDAATPVGLCTEALALPRLQMAHGCVDTPGNARHQDQDRAPNDALAYVIYTSGSTGVPKGVAVAMPALGARIEGLIHVYGMQADDRVLQFATFTFDASVEEVFCTLCRGATLVLRNDQWLESPERFWSLCAAQGITVLDLPTRFFEQLAAAPPAAMPPDLRLVIVGGEALSLVAQQNWQRAGGPVLMNTYGPTEAVVVATAHALLPGASPQETIGRPLPASTVYILDQAGQPVAPGIPGELCIGSAALGHGYIHCAAQTAERFVPDPFATRPGSRLYRTGDRARWREDGTIQFLGRHDDQVKIRGFRVELGEVEDRIRRIEGVKEAVVLANADASGVQRLVAYVVSEAGAALGPQALRQQLREALPDYMVPAAFVQLEALPLMSNGKLNRALLPPASSEDFAGVADEMPSGSIECALASIWQEMLGMDRIGRHQGFFDLGGHSLLAVRMLFRVRQETGLAIPLAVLFQEGSIKGLADWASADRAGRAAQAPTLVPIRPHGQHPALFFIPGTLGTSGPFFRLASRLSTSRALYALQPPGMDGRQAPCTSMAQMAQAHVRSLRAVQPSGPYVLCGHSFGGLLAFEVARQLLAENEQVSRVVLLDSDPACQLNPVQEAVSPDAVQALLQQVAWLTDGPPGSAPLVASETPMSVEDLAVLARVVEAQQSMRHVPTPCAVKLVLIRAEEGGMQGSADARWRELTPHDVDVHGVAGQHYSMLGQHVDALAHTLDHVLRAIDAEERA